MRRTLTGVGTALFLSAAWISAASCDGGETETTTTTATTSSTSAQASSGAGGTGGDGAGGGGQGGAGGGQGGAGGSAGACPADTICLAIKPVESGAVQPGRVIVLWVQLNDDGPDPLPLIAYDAAFDPKAGTIEIPSASILPPPPENLLCDRACDDEAMCPCTGEVKVGIGYVLAVRDTDMNGSISIEEFNNETYGVGYMGVAASENEHIPTPAPYDMLFPEGIDKGTRAYRLIEAGTFDDLGRSMDGDVFDLNVCDAPGPSCDYPFPNLT